GVKTSALRLKRGGPMSEVHRPAAGASGVPDAGLPGRSCCTRCSSAGLGWSRRYDKLVHVLFQLGAVRGAIGGIVLGDAFVPKPEEHIGFQDSGLAQFQKQE